VELKVGSAELPNGVTLSYAEQGDATGAPLLLLPGFGDSRRAYELVLAHLPESIRAVAVSQRGHGDSSAPEAGYGSTDLAADDVAFMDALDLPAAVVVGHSSSCFVAERLALAHPHRVSGLVLLGAPLTLRGHAGLRTLVDDTISKLTDPIDPAFVRDFQLSAITREIPSAFMETVVNETLKVPARVWKEFFEAVLQEDLSQELHRIEAPTLVVCGDRDSILSSEDQEAIAAAIPRARLVVYPGAGHSVHWEEPERLAADLTAFARGLSD
jgi:non-heme chloroperoxidase